MFGGVVGGVSVEREATMCPHVLLQRFGQKEEPHPAFSFSNYELLNASAATEAQNRHVWAR